jgi:hypothetical protein
MPPLSFNLGKPPPPDTPPPVPVAVTLGRDEDRERYKRLLFAKYLVVTHRLGRGDMEAAK